jgi:hypothetical protein
MQMEKKNLKLKNKFTQLIGQVSKMYKEVSNSNNESYLIGRKEALEEILNWFVSSHNGELKYVSATSFFNMIQEKLTKTKTALATNSGDDVEEEIKPTMNFSEIKISDNRKRINKFSTLHDSNNFGNYSTGNEQNMVVENQTNGSGNSSSQNMSSMNTQISFPISIGSLINSNTENNILLNNTQNNALDSLKNSNINNNNQINTNIQSGHAINGDVFSHNLSSTNMSSINSLSEYSQGHSENIFSSNLQPGLFLPNRKRKSINK